MEKGDVARRHGREADGGCDSRQSSRRWRRGKGEEATRLERRLGGRRLGQMSLRSSLIFLANN
jgi:hypothetical protein